MNTLAAPEGAGPSPARAAPAGVAGQFADAEHQRMASLMGMWAFLATEVLFFGGMFTAYIVYRNAYGQAFHEAGRHLKAFWGGVNTAVLLVSSGAVAMAVHHSKSGRARPVALWFAAAILLGGVFIAIKAHEYRNDALEHLIPLRGMPFHFPGPHADQARLFFSIYFVMTGIHAIHLLIGMGLLSVMGAAAWRGRFPPGKDAPVEVVGLYWHFVDAIWVFLYPLFYLMGN
jgi:cytochrome c oxidase subunit III